MKTNNITIITLSFFIRIILSIKHSPLVVQGIQISIYSMSQGSYQLRTNLLYYPVQVSSLIFCFQQLNTLLYQQYQQCELNYNREEYFCIQTFYLQSNQTLILNSEWNSFNLSIFEGIQQTNNNPSQIQLDTINRKITFKNGFFDDLKIYHMITAQSRSGLLTFQQGYNQLVNIKTNHLHTFTHNGYSDTLIAQRYSFCAINNDKIIYIFQGAVYRDQVDHFFTGILVIDSLNQPFHMWGGYSYSTSHAARDMVGYQSYNQKIYDLFSLIAAAPYEDISANINGKKNIIKISNSGNSSILSPQNSSQTPYHFIQFYRQFDTNDTNGDEILMQKIYNRFCFASYFVDYEPEKKYDFSLLDNNYMHDYISCHEPVLRVEQKNIYYNFFTLLILLIFVCS